MFTVSLFWITGFQVMSLLERLGREGCQPRGEKKREGSLPGLK
jgi:hypothetical protein